MKDGLLRLYHTMPYPARCLAASARGAYLYWWRYRGDFEDRVQVALEQDRWSPEKRSAWQAEHLARILNRAATRVPYYREHWTERRRMGDDASWEVLENWPVLDKETVRTHQSALIADDCDQRKMYHLHTSGTTGKPLNMVQGQSSVQSWYALFEARCRRWHGVSRKDRWATIGGQLVAPVSERRPPFWVWNAPMKQLYMSSYHLAPDLIPHYLDALKRYEIAALEVYPSSLYALAEQAIRLGRDDLHMAVAITNAEPLFPFQRDAINEAFHCSTRETYGMAESVASASECEHGQLHTWPEVGWVEILTGAEATPVGDTGDIVCTGLLNTDMPLIRYRVGDRGHFSAATEPCGCGRTLPVLGAVEGRIDDALVTTDGRRIGRLDPVFKADLPIREAQIIQETLERVRVLCVPAPGFSHSDSESIRARIRDRMGDVEVLVEQIDEVPRTSNGKFRAVISHVSAGDQNNR